MTAPRLSERQLAALGLEGTRRGTTMLIPWPEESPGEGAGVGEVALSLALLVSGSSEGRFDPLGIPFVETLGVRLELLQGQRILRVRAPEGEALDVRTEGGAASWGHPGGERCVALVDLSVSGPAALSLPGGTHVAVWATPQGVVAEVRGPAPSQWISSSSDSWLVVEMRHRLDSGSMWAEATAVGMFVRLSLDATRSRRAVEDVLSGRTSSGAGEALGWADGLGESQRAKLGETALVEVAALKTRLANLDAAMTPSEPLWVQELTDVCRTRDDLESVLFLLDRIGAADPLASTLRGLDDEADTFVESIPLRLQLDDEQLRRAAAADPDAWWGRLADWGE